MRSIILLTVVAVALAFDECGENSHFESCGTACPLTCENYDFPPKFCILRCDMGCQCDAGYVQTSDGRCVKPEDCPQRASRIPLKKTCNEKADAGMCLAYIPQWYYDINTGTCEQFIYGGCQGNGNRYSTESECLENCAGVRQQSGSEACDLPAETGVCRGYFRRYFFDRTTGQCEKFVYGGCGGNENNFETVEECQKTCASFAPSACLQEKAIGPCKAYFERYFFNQQTGDCEKFVYGGCQGNSNNFNSLEDCRAVCVA